MRTDAERLSVNPLRWRKMTWAVLAFSVLMLVVATLLIAAGVTSNDDCARYAADTPERTGCDAGSVVFGGVGVMATFCLWFLGFVILSIIWFMTRHERRICPACGFDARKGERSCRRCGYDFAGAVMHPAHPAPH